MKLLPYGQSVYALRSYGVSVKSSGPIDILKRAQNLNVIFIVLKMIPNLLDEQVQRRIPAP